MEIPRKGRPRKNQPVNYVNNKEFLAIILEYKDSGDKKLYEKIGKVVLTIAQRYILKPSFASYDQNRKNEMISDACYYMITASLKDFDIGVSTNAFAYFTQATHNSFLQHINKTKLRESRCSTVNFLENLEEAYDGE